MPTSASPTASRAKMVSRVVLNRRATVWRPISCSRLTISPIDWSGSPRRTASRIAPASWIGRPLFARTTRSEEHTSELQSQSNLVCRLLLEKKKKPEPDRELLAVFDPPARKLHLPRHSEPDQALRTALHSDTTAREGSRSVRHDHSAKLCSGARAGCVSDGRCRVQQCRTGAPSCSRACLIGVRRHHNLQRRVAVELRANRLADAIEPFFFLNDRAPPEISPLPRREPLPT